MDVGLAAAVAESGALVALAVLPEPPRRRHADGGSEHGTSQ
jgi:hypothetical protein